MKMSNVKLHIKIYKAIVVMLVVAFSLSPCSLKRDVLGIFNIQHTSSLNKVKTTALSFSSCQSISSSAKVSFLKADFKFKNHLFSDILQSVNGYSENKTVVLKNYSGNTSGNSPPKYILFKQLKLYMI
ncbi:hypothetical protein LNP04_17405 [Chryseobacterium sp. C-71]|uniref:hypothetical protein n=1 Tax=Chryseobacterium sp. C-71 TaxID=2893882 RepID=UPI001E3AA4D3|nr:hypothetical protein [Chryseobacterium sp. C-71]UFH31717.1 hypothetical protein LNP04_17405 [Chryseobacterium sp. C-71]